MGLTLHQLAKMRTFLVICLALVSCAVAQPQAQVQAKDKIFGAIINGAIHGYNHFFGTEGESGSEEMPSSWEIPSSCEIPSSWEWQSSWEIPSTWGVYESSMMNSST